MKIVVLGATGQTGRLVLERGLATGHTLTAVVRSEARDPLPGDVETVRADVTQANSLAPVLAGADAVIGTLGTTRGPLMERSTAALLEALDGRGPRRIVLLSGYSVITDRLSRPARFMATTVMKAMSQDKATSERLLRASATNWTIVHAARLTNGPATGRARVAEPPERIGLGDSVSRADVADYLVRAVADPGLVGRAVALVG